MKLPPRLAVQLRLSGVAVGLSFLLIVYRATTKNHGNASFLSTKVCVFGSAESSVTALQAAAQLPGFRHWFVVWGEDVPLIELPDVTLLPGRNTTHASAWTMAFEAIQASKHDCEYYFATDDDLQWTVTEVGWKHYGTRSPQDVVVFFLEQWQPAVTTFNWPWGDETFAPLKEMNALHGHKLVQATTGFDNGAMIFHHSVVGFFIPIWLGSGFTPAYTIQHTFQNFFVAFLFGPHAIRLNGLQYHNPPKVRHAYDAEGVAEYKQHITNQMKCINKSWGPMLADTLVNWQPSKGSGNYTIEMSEIALFYNVQDSVISQHPFFLDKNASHVEETVNKLLTSKQDVAGAKRCVTHQKLFLPKVE